jgi:DNA-binding transcriptional LysR family regulator
MALDLRTLRYFVAVAEEMHFGRAAVRLHMTQPPLSQSIQALEAELGCSLFARTKRSVALTAAGKALLPEAQRLLLQADGLAALVQRAAAGESGRLALAFVSSADYSVLPAALREFRAAFPAVQIDLHETTSDLQYNHLAAGSIDLGILIPPIPDKLKAALDYFPVLREPLVLAIPEGSKVGTGNKKISLKNCHDLPLIIFPRKLAPAFHDQILGCFREAGVTPHIGQEAIQMQTIVGLVSAGMGIALVPQSVSNLKRPGVEYRALKEASPLVEIGLAWRKDNTSPVLRAFLKLMKKRS